MFPGENTPASNKTLLSRILNIIAPWDYLESTSRERAQPFPPEKIIMSLQIITILQPPLLNFLRVRFFLSLYARSRALHYAVDVIDGYKFLGFINFYCRARRYPSTCCAGRMKESGDGWCWRHRGRQINLGQAEDAAGLNYVVKSGAAM